MTKYLNPFDLGPGVVYSYGHFFTYRYNFHFVQARVICIQDVSHIIICIEHNKTVSREFNARFKPFRDAQPTADKDSDALSVRSVSTTASTIGRGAHTRPYLTFLEKKFEKKRHTVLDFFYVDVPVYKVPSVGVNGITLVGY
jgi:hypothetical protein